MTQTMSNPIAVLVSDVHFTVSTLDVASAAFLKAQYAAKRLGVTLVVCGDTLDSKAIIRAECANKLIDLLSVKDAPPTIFLVGNHDLINERKSWTFEHSLNFLKPYATVIEEPQEGSLGDVPVLLVPYCHNPTELKSLMASEADSVMLTIMHQGIAGSNSGEYYQDKSALNTADLAGLRVISGHYHARQTITLPESGQFDYVGNPYTLNFGEANDPDKGFQILHSDGSLEFVPTNLRAHRVLDYKFEELPGAGFFIGNSTDILWVKIRGTTDQLAELTKTDVATQLDIAQSFRLDLIPTDTQTDEIQTANKSQPELLDGLIDSLRSTDQDRKSRLKSMWKDLSQGE